MGETYFQESDLRIWVTNIFSNLVNIYIYMPVLCQEYMLFFCLPLSSQPRLNLLSTRQQGRVRGLGPHRVRAPLLLCAEKVEPWLTTQWLRFFFIETALELGAFLKVMLYLCKMDYCGREVDYCGCEVDYCGCEVDYCG